LKKVKKDVLKIPGAYVLMLARYNSRGICMATCYYYYYVSSVVNICSSYVTGRVAIIAMADAARLKALLGSRVAPSVSVMAMIDTCPVINDAQILTTLGKTATIASWKNHAYISRTRENLRNRDHHEVILYLHQRVAAVDIHVDADFLYSPKGNRGWTPHPPWPHGWAAHGLGAGRAPSGVVHQN
jgi:hypothetical protein